MNEQNFRRTLGENAEEVIPLLRAYSISSLKGIRLPSRTYLDEVSAVMDITLPRARELGETYKQRFFKPQNFELRQTQDLYLGMYNATLDIGNVINIGQLRDRITAEGLKSGKVSGITYKALRMTTRHGRFKKSTEYTEEYGKKNLENVSNSKLSSLELIIKIKKGGKVQGASFNIFNTGRVRFSGGYVSGSSGEPVSLVTYVDAMTGLNMSSKSIKINNVTGEIKLGAKIDLVDLYALLNVGKGLAMFDDRELSVTFEPERNALLMKNKKDSPFLYINFGKDFTLLLSANGTVVIEGMKNPEKDSTVVRNFINFLKLADILRPTRRDVIPAPKPSKIARRADMKPAPDVTRRGTTCPDERCPVPYSFQGACPQGNKYYVRPNPQGQPCCYRIPKRLEYITEKVENRYRQANVKVPDSVRKLFGFGANTNTKANNVGKKAPENLRFYFNNSVGKNKKNPVGFKIGSRQCMRYTKVALVDIAARLGVATPSKVSKERLCELISAKMKNKVQNNVGNGLPVVGKDKQLRLGDRLCVSYPKKTIIKYAKELGLTLNPDSTKEEMCREIQKGVNKGNDNFNYFINLARRLKNDSS
jgi:TATA-box binding protein (TBP) (component of TFIID and TFIIIB)